MEKDLVIGIDCSTTASKAILWDRQGQAIAEGRHPIPIDRPRPGWHEQPAESWWHAVIQALRQVMPVIEQNRLAGLSIAVQRETFVPVDENGTALRPGIVWMDERCRALLPEIDRAIGRSKIHQITGKPLSGNLSLGKIAWIKQFEPAVFAKTAYFQDVHSYLVTRLTGQYKTSWGCADPMGLFDMNQGAWSAEILGALGIKSGQLPQAVSPYAYIGEVSPRAAALCGLPVGLPVYAGMGDGQAGALGAGIYTSGQTCVNLGTAAVSATGSQSYLIDPAFRTTYAGNPGSYLLETVLLGGAYTVSWFLDQFGRQPGLLNSGYSSEVEGWEAEAESIPLGAEGLMLVPYWNSAMSPYWDAGASGMVVGWRGIHGRAHLYRAILEGIAYELRLQLHGVEKAMAQLAGPSAMEPGSYTLLGGGARSPLWQQILADVLGREIKISKTVEATSLGAAILAARGAGWYPSIPDTVAAMTQESTKIIVPDPTRHIRYSSLYEDVYRGLFPALQPALDRLTELTEE